MLIPQNLQCRLIAALLNGRLPDGYTLEQLESLYYAFDEPWRKYLGPLLDAMDIPAGIARASFITGYVDIAPEHRAFAYEEAGRTVSIPALDRLELPEIEWLWPGWVPRGMLTLFGAMPSAGKSYVALDLARRVIQGSSFPDGAPVGEPGSVIYVDAENAPQIHNRRALAWGMDRSRLYLMRPEETRLMIDFSDAYDRDRLVEWAWTVRPSLVVIDSLSSITTRGENSVEDVRALFAFLNRLALDYRCALVIIHHLRKPNAQLPPPKSLTFHDLRGSSHISTMSRSIIGLHWVRTGPQPNMNDPRRMDVLKTNLSAYPEGIGVRFLPMEGDPGVAEIVYGAPPESYHEPTGQDECAAWLLELLEQHGPLPSDQAVTLGRKAGFSRPMVYRARRQLGARVIDTVGARRAHNQWALPAGPDENV